MTYRIEFSIQRAEDDGDEFVEIGFGSSGSWGSLNACTHMIDSAVCNGEWETTPEMPRPEDVMRAVDER